MARANKLRSSLSSREKSTTSGGGLPLKHVAIIMDGNRRWADRRHLPRLVGHREGVQSLKRLVRHVSPLGLEFLTVYAFSSENWSRTQEEVEYLMALFAEVLGSELAELSGAGVRLSFIGDLAGMPASLQEKLSESTASTAANQGMRLQVALNYGSRLEIAGAARQIAEAVAAGKLAPAQITPDLISSYLWTAGLPDPDLLIRTGGEMRLSNYLLWQAAYSEIYVSSTMWPDFTPAEFDRAVAQFAERQRRWGGD